MTTDIIRAIVVACSMSRRKKILYCNFEKHIFENDFIMNYDL